MKWLIARRVLNIAAVSAVVIGVALLAWMNLFGAPAAAARTLTVVVWGMWGAIAIGYVVRVVLNLTNKRRVRTKDPLASAADAVQEIYLGRVSTPAPQRQPDEYSAYGSAPSSLPEDLRP